MRLMQVAESNECPSRTVDLPGSWCICSARNENVTVRKFVRTCTRSLIMEQARTEHCAVLVEKLPICWIVGPTGNKNATVGQECRRMTASRNAQVSGQEAITGIVILLERRF